MLLLAKRRANIDSANIRRVRKAIDKTKKIADHHEAMNVAAAAKFEIDATIAADAAAIANAIYEDGEDFDVDIELAKLKIARRRSCTFTFSSTTL